jgi:hypothetical protein
MLRQRELGAVLPNIAALLGFGLLYLALGARLYESRRSA